jgi:hypothetical protein
VEEFGMTPDLGKEKGKEAAAIQQSIQQEINIQVNRRCFLPTNTQKNVSSRNSSTQ